MFKRLLLLSCVLALWTALCSTTRAAVANDVMPKPSSIVAGEGSFAITPGLSVGIDGARSARLDAAVLRTLKLMEDKTGVALPRSIAPDATTGTLVLKVASSGPAVQTLGEDEAYSLVSTATGVVIEAATTVGAMHGLETLLQLAQPVGTAYEIPAVSIHDAPRFRWRGLMIDCGRHFEPVDVLKRNLDAMAAVKLNVFHWHLTEDQGFRIESKVFPKLTAVGSDGLFYTQEEAREVVRYAADRGIRVVPEFEMPGHSAAWLVAYPELASGTVPTGIRRQFGISDTAIDPTREETYTFISRFLKEMTTIFPDQYVHIGGDETPAPDWKTNPRIVSFMKQHGLADNEALQAYFNQRISKILSGLDRKMVGWDEILNPALPKSIVIQSWRGEASLAKAAQGGYQGVLSAPYYLDAMKPAGVPYLADPIPSDTTLTAEQQKLILGGEVAMWAEQLDQRTIDSRIWPRTAAIAERFWSTQGVRDVDDMYRRLRPVSLELEMVGTRQLTSEGAGLRLLAGTDDPEAMSSMWWFAEAFEPVSFGERYQQQHTSQLTPLTGFVDAVVPDPPIRHELELAAKAFLADPKGAAEAKRTLKNFFTRTGASVPKVRELMANSPRLQPMQTRLEQLPGLTQAGLEAVQYLSTGTAAPAGWRSKALAEIEAAKKPSAIVRITFLEPLTEMVNAVQDGQ